MAHFLSLKECYSDKYEMSFLCLNFIQDKTRLPRDLRLPNILKQMRSIFQW